MRRRLRYKYLLALYTIVFATLASSAQAQTWGVRHGRYAGIIQRVIAMPGDGTLQQRVGAHGLNVVNVMWEDTGRFHGSAIGPNISDVTLQVRETTPQGIRTHLLPVIRHPNFTDRTADIAADDLWVRVGNQRAGSELHAIPLSEILAHMKEYLSDADSMLGDGNMLAERDTHFLVSAQHVFVPIPRQGQAEFNPVIFNYQSAPESPAVLVLLVTRQGTSATVIENRPGDQTLQGWGQQLFFNNAGQRTVLTAERRSAVAARIEAGQAGEQDQGALEEGADMMMIVQVPLKHRNVGYLGGLDDGVLMEGAPAGGGMPAPLARSAGGRSNVEQAVLGHGEDLGPFEEMRGLRLERDDRFPVRVTVQFYRATSNGVLSDQDIQEVRDQIARVYDEGDFVGSLVVPESDRTRPTDWERIRRGLPPLDRHVLVPTAWNDGRYSMTFPLESGTFRCRSWTPGARCASLSAH
jgi:hypothetical protein